MRSSIDASANPLAISCASSGVEASAVTVTMFDWATGSAVTFDEQLVGAQGRVDVLLDPLRRPRCW